jgi:glycerol-3-phosphate dehydrogenase
MENASSDIFIIGGGINGVGIAADAAGRGLSVTLCEKGDLAGGTSSASSKLIHGGLRYLANYDFSLVRKALREREILLRKAPHIIWPLEFVLPRAKHLRPAWLIRLGLFLYDHLAAHQLLPDSKKINLRKDERGKDLLPELTTGFSYYDCWNDDARLVVLNALAAREQGANILTRTSCIAADFKNGRWEIQIRDSRLPSPSTHYAKVLINAAGPWVQEVQEKIIHVKNPFTVELIKGTHIIVPKLYAGDYAYILQNSDERIVFAIPFEKNFTLIGTTDVHYQESLEQVKSSLDEENYLCTIINSYFNKNITPKDIVWSYAGVRCLQEDKHHKASKISRDYKFELLANKNLLTVISGKITTYRCLAEEAVDTLNQFFPHMGAAWTQLAPLPGGDIPNADFATFFAEVKNKLSWLPEPLAYRYARSYGTRIYSILQGVDNIYGLGELIGADLYEKELAYLVKTEWAMTSEDVLWRRSKLGLVFTAAEIEKLQAAIKHQLKAKRGFF